MAGIVPAFHFAAKVALHNADPLSCRGTCASAVADCEDNVVTTASTSAQAQTAPQPAALDRFRLRHFVERLEHEGELDAVTAPTDLADIAARLDGNSKAVLFRKAGPEQTELAGNIMGSRRRLALAFDTTERDLLAEVLKRVEQPIAPVEIGQRASAGASGGVDRQ